MHTLVVCARRFNGHELFTLLGILKQRHHTFEVTSQSTLIRDELSARPNTIKRTVYEVPASPTTANTFAGMIIVSGNMKDTEAYWHDPHVEALLHQFQNHNKLTAAICCSVPTLAPIARDKRVSFFPLNRSRLRLLQYGAILQNTSLTVDTNMVTAENQMMTQMWAIEICNVLEGLPPTYNLQDSGFTPKGHERRFPPEIQRMLDAAKRSPT